MNRNLATLPGKTVTLKTADETYVGTVGVLKENIGLWITVQPDQRPPKAPVVPLLSMFFPYAQISWLAVG
jgi:hypothetical protein